MKAIVNGRLIVPDARGTFRVLRNHALLYDRRIVRIVPAGELDANNEEAPLACIDARGAYVSPGFVNVHLHGAAGHDVMDDDADAVPAIARHQATTGVTAMLPTTMTYDFATIGRAIEHIRAAMKKKTGGASVLGAHMEGPFISVSRCGAQDAKHIVPPDFALIEPFLDVLRRITVAPETIRAGDGFLAACKRHGISVSMGHSDADYETARRAILEGGVRHVTHLFNGMAPFHHRTPGLAGAALDTSADCELIADNIHVHPMAQRLLWNAKRGRHIVLVTDSMRAAGLGDGVSELGGQRVHVRDGAATLDDGTLAGSVLTMDRAVANLAANTGANMAAVVSCATKTPARGLGLYDELGSLTPGKRADIVLFDDDVRIGKTIVGGEIVYERA